MHLYTIATVTVHICTITITCVFNILHFFSLSITLSTSHSHLSLVLSLPQSTDQFPDHRYPTYNDHRKSSELSGTTKLKVRKKRRLVEINKQTTKEEAHWDQQAKHNAQDPKTTPWRSSQGHDVWVRRKRQ